MKIVKKKKFQHLIVDIEGLRNVADFFASEVELLNKNGILNIFKFQINTDDGTTYIEESISILDDKSIFLSKKVIEIQLTLYSNDKYIAFNMTEGNYNATLILEGTDENWLKSSYLSLCERIEGLEKKRNFISRHEMLIENLIALSVGKLLYAIIQFFLLGKVKPVENPSGLLLDLRNMVSSYPVFFYLIFYWMFPWICGWGLRPKTSIVNKFWPSIEFDFVNGKFNNYKSRRSVGNFVIIMFAIPLAIAILYDMMKLLFVS